MIRFQIKTISPLHIGDNDTKTLSSILDFVVDEKNNRIRKVDYHKLENLFKNNPEIMEDYIKEIKFHSGTKYNLIDFFQKWKIDLETILSKDSRPIIGKFDAKEIHPFISQNGKNYIPGSTIKGAIRNALLYSYYKENNLTLNIQNINNKTTRQIETEIFGKNAQKDILKLLIVGDSDFFEDDSLALFPTKNLHLTKLSNSIPINYECVLPNKTVELQMKIKNNFPFQKFGTEKPEFWKKNLNFSFIFKSLNMLSKKFIERELEVLPESKIMQPTIKFYSDLLKEIDKSKDNKAYFAIGKGTTILLKTVLLLLSEEKLETLRNNVKENKSINRNFGWKMIRKGRNIEYKISEKFPVTRLIYEKSAQTYQAGLGWLVLEEI